MTVLKLDAGLRVKGHSGQLYYFEEHFYHPKQPLALEEKAAVYLFLRKKNDGKYYPVFCGQTPNLADIHLCQASRELIRQRKPNRLCVLYQENEAERKNTWRDLLANANYQFVAHPFLAPEEVV